MNHPPRPQPLRRSLIAALAFGAAGLRAAEGAAPPRFVRRPWPKRQPTPSVELPTREGPLWRLADARGQVVVLNFWATWCEPCLAELPSLERLAQRHERDRLRVMAVNYREGSAAIDRFVQRMPTTLPILRDADGAATRAFGISVFPTTVIIGRDGRAAFSVVGELDWAGTDARVWVSPLL